tara:strand:+ start:1641 stop:2123 length:483 start_codon:yes stop_codon:yes gene_type:complete
VIPSLSNIFQILDFGRYSEWHSEFVQSMNTIPPGKNPQKLLQGETLNAKIRGVKLVPIVKSNTSTELSWHGSAMGGAFSGKHYFQFFESHVTPGGTTFVHGEDYDGWMTWMFGKGIFGIGRRGVVRMFDSFSKDVKMRAEEMKKLKEGIAKTQSDPWVKL